MAAFNLGDIFVTLKTKTGQFTSGLAAAEKSASSFSKGVAKSVGIATAAFGTLAVAVGTKAVKEFASFEQRMSDINTLVGKKGTAAVNQLGDGIKELAKQVPKSPDELGASAYSILSAGITDTDKALAALKASAKLAVAGLGTTEEATDLMTSSLNAFKGQGLDADKAMNVLFKTVKNGKTTVADLAGGFGQVAPIAAAAKVKFEELQAATAALTLTGLGTSEAQTQIRQSILALQAPNNEMLKLIKKLGFSSGQTMLDQLGMVGSMNKIQEAAKGDTVKLKLAYGSVEALGAATSLTGVQNEAFTNTYKDLTNGVNDADEAFEIQKQTLTNTWNLIKNNVQVALINLGSQIVDLGTKAIDFVKNSEPLQNFFKEVKDFIFNNLIPTIKDLWARFLEILPTIQNMATTLGTILLPPLKDLWNTFATELLPTLQEFWEKHGPAIMKVLEVVGKIIGGVVVVALLGFIETIKQTIKAITWIINVVSAVFSAVKFVIQSNIESAKKFLSLFGIDAGKVWDGIKEAASKAFGAVVGFIQNIIDKFNEVKQKAKDFVSSLPGGKTIASLIPGFASGVRNFGGGWAWAGENGPELIKLPKGSDVFSTSDTRRIINSASPQVSNLQAQAAGAAGGGSNTYNINISGAFARSKNEMADLFIAGMRAADQRRVSQGKSKIIGS